MTPRRGRAPGSRPQHATKEGGSRQERGGERREGGGEEGRGRMSHCCRRPLGLGRVGIDPGGLQEA